MSNPFIVFYITISALVFVIDIFFAVKAFGKSNAIGRYMGLSAICAALVDAAYLGSVLITEYRLMSAMSSIYFLSIDWMLVFLTHFVILYTGMVKQRAVSVLEYGAVVYALFDTAVLIVNIFREIAIHYHYRGTPVAAYTYVMKPLYYMHLAFTYLLVVMILYILADKSLRTPRQYRNQYVYLTSAILLVVAVNAVFLFPIFGDGVISLLDFSIVGYSLGLYLMYWSSFQYRMKDMLESLSMTIFENMDQGIVLFDYMDCLIMHNQKSEQLLPRISFREEMPVSEFLALCDLPEERHIEDDAYSIQCYSEGETRGRPLRCDFRRLRDDKNHSIGNLFVFADASKETDLLTGFHNWPSFKDFAEANPQNFSHPTAVAIFDINGLAEVNRTHGKEVGDQYIRSLVKIMHTHLPLETYFVRGHEAHLVALCYHTTEGQIKTYVEQIAEDFGSSLQIGLSSTQSDVGILEAISLAARSLQVKKLLDTRSSHSQTLTSLVRALQEADSDTEAHVRRTQKMGAMLGERIGLTDAQQSDLSLLCLLHDIGKIGIPLEILNKPGKLSDEEWRVLRTHPEKGYQIAMSSSELEHIADMILHHHERWDGKGYPDRLAGRDIPILARIISIVDSYDAMVNNRSYRRAMPPEAAQAEIRRCAGTQFDPNIAEQFLLTLEEHPEIATGELIGGDDPGAHLVRELSQQAPSNRGSTYDVPYSRYLLDPNDRIVEVDDAFPRLTGYTREDIASGQMYQIDLIPPEDQTSYLIHLDNQFSHGSIAYLEHKIRRKDGKDIHVFCSGKRYFDSAVKSYRSEVVIFDITNTHFVKDISGVQD